MNLRRREQVNFYIVFGSVRRPTDFMGGKHLDWSQPPVGVYQANSPEEACQTAARDQGQMATYFAVQGTPWGVDLLETPARQLGQTQSATERLAAHLERIDQLEQERRQLEAEAKHHHSTPAERIAAAEERSREMEREAGIGVDEEH